MSIVVVDYGIGNLGAIPNMLRRLNASAEITSDRGTIQRASKLILPGVGAFDAGMQRLRELKLDTVLHERASNGVIVLGLCLGMHLMFDGSAEGVEPGLGWIAGQVMKFATAGKSPPLPVPQMGWNLVSVRRPHPILANLGTEPRFYFAHSYYAHCDDPADVLATTNYGGEFPSVVARKNVIGAQFHPEKSHRFGLQLFRNFVAL
jgi:imidazole glycerol-phosphate synthase subunit HisH